LQRPPRWPRESGKPTEQKPDENSRALKFAALDRLKVGEPFNPYKLFVYGEVLRAMAAFSELSDSGYRLWTVLADQVQNNGIDTHSHTKLAGMVRWDDRKFRRIIRELKNLKLVHVEWNFGRPARTWLLYHPVFALCSPLIRTNLSSDTGQIYPLTEDKFVHNMDLPHGSLHGRGDTTFNVGTSNRGTSEAQAEDKAKTPPPKNDQAAVPITNRVSTLSVLPEARSFFSSLSSAELKIRYANGDRAKERVAYYRQYINETDRTIAGQARKEVHRWLSEVRSLGFFIPGFDQKEKP
jgi:hypothetical protein